MKRLLSGIFLVAFCSCSSQKNLGASFGSPADVLGIIEKVNDHWQAQHSPEQRAFWDEAAYHTGNMAAYAVTQKPAYRNYSERWASHNQWMGASSNDSANWKFNYGETSDHVLFGDWQICFQTYIDLYRLDPDPIKIRRAKQVMNYEMNTLEKGYWWWADGLYMVMPVMVKLYTETRDPRYLHKLVEYYQYADQLMHDSETGFYYRDAKYVYPAHKTVSGKKDFWARGNGWVLAGLAKVLQEMPKDFGDRQLFIDRFRKLANAVRNTQQSEGYWTRSLLAPDFAPGYETSGTAFFTYGILWGINNGILDRKTFLPVVEKSWRYLATIALQPDGSIGYVQPIGERAIPGQVVDKASTANFGVGAFLLAASEMYRYLSAAK